MRVTADTNVVISGLLWRGNPRRVLDAARDGIIELFTSQALLEELTVVIGRGKFAHRLAAAAVTVGEVVDGFASLASIVDVSSVRPVIVRDPDDDQVLACALSAECEVIVSGDDDLLSLGSYQEIHILTPTDLLKKLFL